MSCGPSAVTFRLVDGYVGWDVDTTFADSGKGIEGLETVDGVALARLTTGAIDPPTVDSHLLPTSLARGCGPCEWYLVTRDRPVLARRDRCSSGCFAPVFGALGTPGLLVTPVAVAAERHWIAIADPGASRVWVASREGERILAAIPVESPGALALAPSGEVLVVVGPTGTIARFTLTGERLGTIAFPLDTASAIDRMSLDADCGLWVVTRQVAASSDPEYRVWHAARTGLTLGPFVPATNVDVLALASTGLTLVDPAAGFCFQEMGPDGFALALCFDWQGCPVDGATLHPPPFPTRAKQGQLLTVALDSGVPRCRWHRVEIDADLPFGTSLEVAVASTEVPDLSGAVFATPDAAWNAAFPGGRPHPDEWRTLPARGLDALIDQPPGRYLYVRLRLTGDGQATPIVRRVRLDLPRSTSLDRLPSVYREDPQAEDFSERFLSLFDSSIADLDRAIVRAPALLDSQGVPDEVLPWIGSLLDVAFDPSWSAARRRDLLAAVPALYRARGTPAGLIQAIAKMTGVTVAIEELALERAWGALAGPGAPRRLPARLRGVRLFGKARARMRLGASPLGGAPLRSFGNPDQDPLNALAYRFRVLAPPDPADPLGHRKRIERAVASQKPAHTVASVRIGGAGFMLGSWSAVGIDTALVALPAPVLGATGNVRLGRMSVVWPGPRGCGAPLRLGESSAIGVGMMLG